MKYTLLVFIDIQVVATRVSLFIHSTQEKFSNDNISRHMLWKSIWLEVCTINKTVSDSLPKNKINVSCFFITLI